MRLELLMNMNMMTVNSHFLLLSFSRCHFVKFCYVATLRVHQLQMQQKSLFHFDALTPICVAFMKYSLPEAFSLGLINWWELFSTSEKFQRHKSSSANVFNEILFLYGAHFSSLLLLDVEGGLVAGGEADSMKISYDGDDKLCEEQKTREKLGSKRFQGSVLASEGCFQWNCARW